VNPVPEPLPNAVPTATPHKKPKPKRPHPRSAAGHDYRMAKRPRLPNGSRWEHHWDGVAGRHVGFLRIPLGGDEWLSFAGSAPGVFRLLEQLDDQYRAWLVQHTAAAVGTDPSTKGGA
jgi:hypothetical protein